MRINCAIMFLGLAATAAAADLTLLPNVKRVVFLGDSITYSGQYIEDVEAYFVTRFPERHIEFLNIGLPSETVSGLSEPGHADGAFPRPGVHERLERVLEKTKPDLVIACYGMNDGIYCPFTDEYFQKYQDGMLKLRERAKAAHAKVIHLTPPTFDPVPLKGRTSTREGKQHDYRLPYEGYNDVLDRYSDWLLGRRKRGWDVADIHGPMNRYLAEHRQQDPNFFLAGDGVHCNETGHWIMAKQLLLHLGAKDLANIEDAKAMLAMYPNGEKLLTLIQQRQRMMKDTWLTEAGHKRPGMNKGLPLAEAQAKAAELETQIRELAKAGPAPFPGTRSDWNGFDKYDFVVDGKPVLVVAPKTPAPGKPWVWHGEFFGHKPAPDIALLRKGFHIVYMSVPDMLGCPEAVEHWNAFYKELTAKYGFAKKAALVGLSRGGLYCYNWAEANPNKVACIYADAAVCDFKSWPGGKGKGKGSAGDWKLVMERYHFKDEAEALAYTKNPVDNLAPLAKAKVPLLHVYGDADDAVPWDENTGVVAERYKKLGGSITLIVKKGVGHHPHGLEDSTPIIEFIRKNSSGN